MSDEVTPEIRPVRSRDRNDGAVVLAEEGCLWHVPVSAHTVEKQGGADRQNVAEALLRPVCTRSFAP